MSDCGKKCTDWRWVVIFIPIVFVNFFIGYVLTNVHCKVNM